MTNRRHILFGNSPTQRFWLFVNDAGNQAPRAHGKIMKAQTASLVRILAFIAISNIASAQIFVADSGQKRIAEYSLSGAPINLSFITGFDTNSEGPLDIAV